MLFISAVSLLPFTRLLRFVDTQFLAAYNTILREERCSEINGRQFHELDAVEEIPVKRADVVNANVRAVMSLMLYDAVRSPVRVFFRARSSSLPAQSRPV